MKLLEAKIIVAKSKLPLVNKIDKLQREVCQLKKRIQVKEKRINKLVFNLSSN